MKKRVLSLLMALCLLLGLIPALTAPAAAANDSACLRYIDDIDDTATESRYYDTELTLTPNGTWFGVFYTYENNSYGTVLENPTFSFTAGSAELEIWEYDEQNSSDGNVIYMIEPQEFGDGTLLIESGGKTYAMDYTVELPVIGFYKSTTRSEANFLQDYTFRYDDDSRTFYLLMDPNADMTLSNPRVDMANNGGDPADVKVTRSSSTRVKITLPTNTTPEGEYRLRFTITDSNESWEDWIWFNLENNAPTVRYRSVYYNDGQAYEEGPFRTVLTIPAIYSRSVTFYYGTAESATPLQNYNVSVNDHSLAEIRLRSDRPLADGRKPIQLNGTGIGSTTLTFKMDSGETYTMPLNVELPEFGRYDEQEFSEDALIWDEVYDSREDTVFWLMTKEGFENPQVSELEIYQGDAEIDFVQRGTSDYYDVRVTIPKGTRGGVGFYLRVWGSNVGNWGTDVWLEDEAPGLRYAYIGYDDNDEPYLRHEGRIYSEYNQAMRSKPAMIFYYGTAENPIPLTANSLADAPAITFTNLDGLCPDSITAEPEALFSGDGHTNAVVYALENIRLDIGTLSVTVNGETYSMNARVGLPQFYFYTEREISFNSMLEDTVYESGQETVLWLMTEEGHENGTITELDIRSGNVKAELVPRDDDPDVSDVKITIPATARGDLNFYIHVSADNGGWGNSFRLQDTAPGLYYNYAMRNNGVYYEEGDLESSRRQQLSYTCTMVLYYGNKSQGNLTPIIAADPESSPEITVIPVSGGDPAVEVYARTILDNSSVVYCLNPLAVGECLLSYTVGGVEYTMPVSVTLPTDGFYSSKTISEETLLRNREFTYKGDQRTAYFQTTDEDASIVSLTLDSSNSVDFSDMLSIRKVSDQCWAITLEDHPGYAGGTPSISFSVEKVWDDGDTDNFRTSLQFTCGDPLVSVPTVLRAGNRPANSKALVAFYDNGVMVDVRVVPEDQILLEATGLEKGMTYRFFCLDATGHHPLLNFFPGTL